jgi:tetratricopeptide (TPR) repeat protein
MDAITCYQDGIAMLRNNKNNGYLASQLQGLGRVMQKVGDMGKAFACYQESLDLAYEARSANLIVRNLYFLAALEETRGQRQEAIGHAQEAADRLRRLGMQREQAEAEVLLARLSDAEGAA